MDAVIRFAYRTCYLITLASGRAAAQLAGDFRELGAAGRHIGPFVLLLQVPVLLCWSLVRPISLAGFAGCVALAARLEA